MNDKSIVEMMKVFQFHTRVVPSALRCAYCMGAYFQAFKDDIYIVTYQKCLECLGKGIAPIPPVEVGL